RSLRPVSIHPVRAVTCGQRLAGGGTRLPVPDIGRANVGAAAWAALWAGACVDGGGAAGGWTRPAPGPPLPAARAAQPLPPPQPRPRPYPAPPAPARRVRRGH